jgi:hypothetical protein
MEKKLQKKKKLIENLEIIMEVLIRWSFAIWYLLIVDF